MQDLARFHRLRVLQYLGYDYDTLLPCIGQIQQVHSRACSRSHNACMPAIRMKYSHAKMGKVAALPAVQL